MVLKLLKIMALSGFTVWQEYPPLALKGPAEWPTIAHKKQGCQEIFNQMMAAFMNEVCYTIKSLHKRYLCKISEEINNVGPYGRSEKAFRDFLSHL
jgi:hypothetical protein